MIRLKKQKGFTMLELVIAMGLTLSIFIASMSVIQAKSKRSMIDEVAYTTALKMYKLSIPAKQYIDDNIADGLPSHFTAGTLANEGYIDNDIADTMSETPLGRNLEFYVNNDNGFSLNAAMYQVGNIDKTALEKYDLDTELNLINLQRRVVVYLQSMTENEAYDIGIVDEDYQMSNASSSNSFSLDDFISRDQVNISSEKSTALFFNMQENPGYWVFNMLAKSYLDDNLAEENSDENTLYSIGYSDFCPEDGIKPENNVSDSMFSTSEMRRSGGSNGNYYLSTYVCLPASELVVGDTYNAEDGSLGQEIELKNEFEKNYAYEYLLDDCHFNNTTSNVVEFKIGQQYYTYRYISGRVDYQCYTPFVGFFHAFRVENGRFIGTDTKSSVMNFSSYYRPTTTEAEINRVVLK